MGRNYRGTGQRVETTLGIRVSPWLKDLGFIGLKVYKVARIMSSCQRMMLRVALSVLPWLEGCKGSGFPVKSFQRSKPTSVYVL